MILSILKIIVTIIVAIFTITVWCIKAVLNVLTDGAKQASAATPGVVEALKAEASTVAAKAPGIASTVEADIRKVFRVPTREKVEAAQSN